MELTVNVLMLIICRIFLFQMRVKWIFDVIFGLFFVVRVVGLISYCEDFIAFAAECV